MVHKEGGPMAYPGSWLDYPEAWKHPSDALLASTKYRKLVVQLKMQGGCDGAGFFCSEAEMIIAELVLSVTHRRKPETMDAIVKRLHEHFATETIVRRMR